jgi:hypothetical protein
MLKINADMENTINTLSPISVSWKFGEGFIQKINPWNNTSATTYIKWGDVMEYKLKNIDINGKSFIGYDRDGNIIDKLEKNVTREDCLNIVWLGFVEHKNGSII